MEYKKDRDSVILKPVQPAEPTKPEIIIKVRAAGKEATLLLHPTGPNTLPPVREDIAQALEAQKIRFGINWPLVNDLCKRPEFYHVFVIARYAPPTVGADGYVEYLFNTVDSFQPKINEDGTADYKNINYIKSAEKGQVLCRRYPAAKGADGTDVFGLTIPGIFGKDPMNPAGKNTALNEDETELIAQVSGRIRHSFGIVSIEEVLVLEAVDNSTGNIDFIGSLVVKGDVAPGFEIRATGDITVKGSVEGAVIHAGKSVVVSGGVFGKNTGTLAGSDIRCKFIQNCDVTATGNIYADSILHSKVKSGGDVILSGGQAALVGGQVVAAGKVVAKSIGNSNHVVTEVVINAPNSLIEDITNQKKAIVEQSEELSSILNKLDMLEQQKKSGKAEYKLALQKEVEALTKRYNDCTKRREDSEKVLADLVQEWEKDSKGNHYVECKGIIYASTSIRINGEHLALKDDHRRSRVVETEDGLTIIDSGK